MRVRVHVVRRGIDENMEIPVEILNHPDARTQEEREADYEHVEVRVPTNNWRSLPSPLFFCRYISVCVREYRATSRAHLVQDI